MEEELIEWIEGYIETHGTLPTHFLAKEKAMELSRSGMNFKASKGWYEKFLNRHFSTFKNQINKSRNEESDIVCEPLDNQNNSSSKVNDDPDRLIRCESRKGLSTIRKVFLPDPFTPLVKQDAHQKEATPSIVNKVPSEASDSVIEPDFYQQSIRRVGRRSNFTDVKSYKRV